MEMLRISILRAFVLSDLISSPFGLPAAQRTAYKVWHCSMLLTL